MAAKTMSLDEFGARVLAAEYLAALDAPRREAALAQLEADAATVPEPDSAVARRTVQLVRDEIGDLIRRSSRWTSETW